MFIDIVMVLLILTNLAILGTSRLSACVRLIATQGIALAFLPLIVHGFVTELIILAAITFTVKAFVLPLILSRTLLRLSISREEDPYVGFGLSLVFGPLALAFSWWISTHFPLPSYMTSSMVVPVSMFTLIVGLFLIIARKKAFTQVIGYVVLENGIYAFGISLAQNQPLLIELGVLLDVFVGVFVMGIIIFHISRQFDHIDTDQLSSLRR